MSHSLLLQDHFIQHNTICGRISWWNQQVRHIEGGIGPEIYKYGYLKPYSIRPISKFAKRFGWDFQMYNIFRTFQLKLILPSADDDSNTNILFMRKYLLEIEALCLDLCPYKYNLILSSHPRINLNTKISLKMDSVRWILVFDGFRIMYILISLPIRHVLANVDSY